MVNKVNKSLKLYGWVLYINLIQGFSHWEAALSLDVSSTHLSHSSSRGGAAQPPHFCKETQFTMFSRSENTGIELFIITKHCECWTALTLNQTELLFIVCSRYLKLQDSYSYTDEQWRTFTQTFVPASLCQCSILSWIPEISIQFNVTRTQNYILVVILMCNFHYLTIINMKYDLDSIFEKTSSALNVYIICETVQTALVEYALSLSLNLQYDVICSWHVNIHSLITL